MQDFETNLVISGHFLSLLASILQDLFNRDITLSVAQGTKVNDLFLNEKLKITLLESSGASD